MTHEELVFKMAQKLECSQIWKHPKTICHIECAWITGCAIDKPSEDNKALAEQILAIKNPDGSPAIYEAAENQELPSTHYYGGNDYLNGQQDMLAPDKDGNVWKKVRIDK